jgi:hypothetical protein
MTLWSEGSFQQALDRLEVKKVGAEAYLFRVKILGY